MGNARLIILSRTVVSLLVAFILVASPVIPALRRRKRTWTSFGEINTAHVEVTGPVLCLDSFSSFPAFPIAVFSLHPWWSP